LDRLPEQGKTEEAPSTGGGAVAAGAKDGRWRWEVLAGRDDARRMGERSHNEEERGALEVICHLVWERTQRGWMSWRVT
jgi:hypothetical protein